VWENAVKIILEPLFWLLFILGYELIKLPEKWKLTSQNCLPPNG
jgi:hypothetical protein